MRKFIVLLLPVIIVFCSPKISSQGYWDKISQPTDKLLRNVFFVDSATGWCAGAEGIIFHTTNGGKNWIEQNSTVNTFIIDLFFLNKSLGWAVTLRDIIPFGTTILKTTNAGMDWIAIDYPEDNVFMNVIFYFDSLNGWLGGSKIVSTSDGGLNWIDAAIDSGLVSNLPVLNFNFYNRRFGYACGGFIDLAGVIWRTTDYGLNWSATGVSPDQVFDLFVFDSLNALTLSGDPEGFFGVGDIKTSNAGENWSFEELPLFALSFAIDFRTNTEGWSASGTKFLFTLDRGGTWVEKLTPDNAVIFDLTFTDSTTGYAVGENGIILKYKQNTTKVEDNINLQEKFVLHQNFPNPFNPNTSIQYAVNSRQFVSLKVYDVMGNEVAVLVNEEKPAGEYDVEFSAGGSAFGGIAYTLASGIYFYQLWAGSFIQTKKMVYLK